MAHYIEAVPGRTIQLNKQEYLYFGGTSYLGLQSDSRFRKLHIRNTSSYGSHHGASRISNLRLSIYEKAERHLAIWSGSPAALTISSGFLAGQLVRSFFEQNTYQIFMAPNTHAALSREGQSVYSSYQHLAQTLNRYLAGKNTKIPVLFMDSFDFSGNTYPHYENLKTLPLKQLVLVADDSHGIGILGKDGGGAYGQLAGLPAKELIVCGSLGKALGLQGGFVLGLSKRIESLMRTPIFAGASPTSPANMATLVAATPIFAENRESLFTKVRLFESECLCLDRFSFMSGYPVYGYEDDALTASLFASGIFVTDFKYPSVQPNALPGRIVLSAHHTKADIRRLAGFLNSHYTNQ